MDHDHARAGNFEFQEDRHTAVFICEHVAFDAPVLFVSHDAEGRWSFLCGGRHDGPDDKPRLVCLEHVVANDPSLNALAKLCTNHSAERASVNDAWRIADDAEEFIRQTVAEHGWAVQLIPPGPEGEPAFAYTVGLFQSFGFPELIVLGLPLESMQAILNDLGRRIRDGERPKPGDRISDVLTGYDVRLNEVRAEESYREHVGYALWFYEGKPFPLLQVLWPDKEGRFPGEPGAAEFMKSEQPVLP